MVKLKQEWIEKLKSGKEVYVTFWSKDQDGLDGISGVLNSLDPDGQAFTIIYDQQTEDIQGFTADEVLDVELCTENTRARDPHHERLAGGDQSKGSSRKVRLTTMGGTEVDGSLLELNAEELVIRIEDSSGKDQENLIRCPLEDASKVEWLS